MTRYKYNMLYFKTLKSIELHIPINYLYFVFLNVRVYEILFLFTLIHQFKKKVLNIYGKKPITNNKINRNNTSKVFDVFIL